MKTVIFKWNPGFSSYSMRTYLHSLWRLNESDEGNFNWSVWDHDQIHEGDRFYWVKLGYGAKGIVGAGEIISEPFELEDWSQQGRQTFYVQFEPEVLINPDTLPILDTRTLDAEIPDFEWSKGHSGLVLTDEQAAKLEDLWQNFLDKNMNLFEERAENKNAENDKFYIRKIYLE